eukprot:COSAG02_NODE_10871_length_1841_cov_31.150976_2_plen_36_part_01
MQVTLREISVSCDSFITDIILHTVQMFGNNRNQFSL